MPHRNIKLFCIGFLAAMAVVMARPEPLTIDRDLVYREVDGISLRLDVYRPAGKPEKPYPLVVWIHGGAWLEGSKDHNRAAFLVEHGYVTASIQYRLSRQAIWPAQIHDCKAAIRYLRAHAEKWNFDPNKIGVFGASAGGHLAAMLGTSGDVIELEGDVGQDGPSSRVQAVVDFFGPTNFIEMTKADSRMDHAAANSPESLLIGGPVLENPDKVRSVDPITYVTPDDPPFLIVHGDQDFLVPYNQSELLHKSLVNAGGLTELITVKGGGHGGWDDKTLPTNREVMEKVIQFFDRHLK